MNYKDLIINIIDAFKTKHIGFGKTRLIKIAYLTELEFFRRKRERLTDANWIYYKYGPYPQNYQDYLEHRLIEIEDKDEAGFQPIKIKEYGKIPEIPDEIKRIINHLIEQYGKIDLNKLLDYVYYDTEPMMNVEKRGEYLNFDTVLPNEYYKINKFDNTEKAQKSIKRKYKDRIKNARKL